MSYHQFYTVSPFISDYFLYFFMLVFAVFVWRCVRVSHLRKPWRRVFVRPVGMVTVVVLLFYVLIGFVDSIHIKSDYELVTPGDNITQVSALSVRPPRWKKSVLDLLFGVSSAETELTYSSPLAWYDFSQSTVTSPSGVAKQVYLPLRYAGKHNLSSSHVVDVLLRILIGVCYGLVWCIVLLCFVGVLNLVVGRCRGKSLRSVFRHYLNGVIKVVRGQTELAWRAAFVTFFLIVILVMVVVQLSHNYHLLGTNKIGEDVLYVSLKSVRTGLLIGALSIFFMLPFALVLGPFAGYFGGWVDDLIQYIYTTVSSIPGVLLISACLLILKAYINQQVMLANSSHVHSAITHRDYRDDIQFIGLCMILGLTSWAGLCRLLRAETLKLREQPFVTASKVLGQNSIRIIFRHILPNVMHIVLITVVLDFSGLILAEAVLTYVGVGVPLSLHSWGNMINSARLELSRDPVVWWPLVSAIGFMFVFVLCINLFADTVRDAFDPRG